MIKKNDFLNDKELLNFPPITVGEVLAAIKELRNIFENQLNKNREIFYGLPLKIVIKRFSNQKVVDLIGIKRIELSNEGSCIWLVCSTNESNSIFIHDKSIVKLKLSTKSIGEISKGVDYFKTVFEDQFRKSKKNFLDLPVKIVVVSGSERKNEKVVDTLNITTLLMDDIGSGIFCHSLIDDIKMIQRNPKLEKLLDEAENQFTKLMIKLSQKS